MGDPVRLVMLDAVIKEIKANNLLENAKNVGTQLQADLRDLEVYMYNISTYRYIQYKHL